MWWDGWKIKREVADNSDPRRLYNIFTLTLPNAKDAPKEITVTAMSQSSVAQLLLILESALTELDRQKKS